MTPTIILRASPTAPVVLNLQHEVYCAAIGDCQCSRTKATVVSAHPKTGQMLPRMVERRVQASLSILPGGRSAPLPRAVLRCHDVVAAVTGNRLFVEDVVAEAPQPVPSSAAAPGAPGSAAALPADDFGGEPPRAEAVLPAKRGNKQ